MHDKVLESAFMEEICSSLFTTVQTENSGACSNLLHAAIVVRLVVIEKGCV